jgi:hypothetical protein
MIRSTQEKMSSQRSRQGVYRYEEAGYHCYQQMSLKDCHHVTAMRFDYVVVRSYDYLIE